MQSGFWSGKLLISMLDKCFYFENCAHLEITAGHKVYIYACDLMYHKLYIFLFHLASQRDHTIFFAKHYITFTTALWLKNTYGCKSDMYTMPKIFQIQNAF